jgi:hypothetical protein
MLTSLIIAFVDSIGFNPFSTLSCSDSLVLSSPTSLASMTTLVTSLIKPIQALSSAILLSSKLSRLAEGIYEEEPRK